MSKYRVQSDEEAADQEADHEAEHSSLSPRHDDGHELGWPYNIQSPSRGVFSYIKTSLGFKWRAAKRAAKRIGSTSGGAPQVPAGRSRAGLSFSRLDEDTTDTPAARKCPEEEASWLSKVFFSYADSLVKRGYKQALEQQDLWDLSRQDEAGRVSDAFRQHMRATSDPSKAAQGSLSRALWRVHGRGMIGTGVLKVFHDAIMFLQPFILEQLLHHMTAGGGRKGSLLLAGALLLTALAENVTVNIYFHILWRMSMHMKIEMIQVIYDKSLRITSAVRTDMGVGAIVNLQSNDASKIWSLPLYFHIIWNGPLQILAVMAMLVRIMHWMPALAGLLVTVIMIPLTTMLGRWLATSRKAMMKYTDARIKLITEVITGVKAIKLYAWEAPYMSRILELREQELKQVRTTQSVSLLNMSLFTSGPVLVSLAAFATFAALGFRLTPAIAFPALALFNLLRFPIIMFPSQIMSIIYARLGLQRIQRFLEADEMGGSKTGGYNGNSDASAYDSGEVAPSVPAISMQNGNFAWQSGDANTLKEINLSVKRGQLMMVVGEVGSGKSSLLGAILGEMHCKTGSVRVEGAVAYTAQDPWIQNSTLRNNITMGSPFDESRYLEVLEASALEQDLEQLPAGDASEIGEKGINLSGGQKHRVALARACYSNADIILLDDPLSAVDAHVGRHLFDDCICGYLVGKTRVLVTHQLQYLPSADVVVVMSEGRVAQVGTYNELLARGLNLKDIVAKRHDLDGKDADAARPGGTPNGKANVTADGTDTPTKDSGDALQVAFAKPQPQTTSVPTIPALLMPSPTMLHASPPTLAPSVLIDLDDDDAERSPRAIPDDAVTRLPKHIGNGAAVTFSFDSIETRIDSPTSTCTTPVGATAELRHDLAGRFAGGAAGGPGPLLAGHGSGSAGPLLGVGRGGGGAGSGMEGSGYAGRRENGSVSSSVSANELPSGFRKSHLSRLSHVASYTDSDAAEVDSACVVSSPKVLKEQLREQSRVRLMRSISLAQCGKDGKIVKVEERAKGQVERKVYRTYLAAWGKYFILPALVIVTSVGERGLQVGQNFVLSDWSNAAVATTSAEEHKLRSLTWFYLILYFALAMASILCQIIRSVLLIWGSVSASRLLHRNLLAKVIRLPQSFFESQPTGRLLNRFTKDVDTVDVQVSGSVSSAMTCAVTALFSILVVLIISPAAIVAVIPLAYVYYRVQAIYISSSRELKRLDSLAFSPIFQHFNESLQGLQTIRAFRKQDLFINKNMDNIDTSNRVYWPIQVVNRWLSMRLELLGSGIVFAAAIVVAVLLPRNAGLAGLALTSALNLTGIMNWMVRQTTELEVNMNSVERMIEYDQQEEEAPSIRPDHRPPKGWPAHGALQVSALTVSYRPSLPPVLKGVSFNVESCQKIGVCGRTGCGKSTLMLSLFRIIEPTSGQILLDGVDITQIGLADLRTCLSLVPQDPVIFSGTYRSNLDPFSEMVAVGGKSQDAAIWEALRCAGIDGFVRDLENGLDSPIKEGGANMSVGQRQLLCMARALMRNSKILVLDEATSNVDNTTDELIQRTIRSAFDKCTVLTIAHRLHTIIDSDRVLVLNDGCVDEYDAPAALLQRPSSSFAKLVAESSRDRTNQPDVLAVSR